MDRKYTAEEMLKSDIQAFKKGCMAGLKATLTSIQFLDKGICTHQITHEEAWNIIMNVLARKLKEGELSLWN